MLIRGRLGLLTDMLELGSLHYEGKLKPSSTWKLTSIRRILNLIIVI